MVCARYLVSALAGAWLVLAAAWPAGVAAEPERVPLEQRPYQIRAWVDLGAGVRLGAAGRARLVADWQTLVHRFVGAPWELDVAAGAGPLLGRRPGDLDAADLAERASGLDKLWMIRIGVEDDGRHVLEGRAFDTLTGRLGPVFRRHAPHPDDLARPLLRLALDLFTPTAEVETTADGAAVRLTVQGAALTPADPVGAIVGPGSLFVPVRIFLTPDGATRQVVPIGWSYLRVEELAGASARCTVVSGLRDPLSRRIVGRHRLAAVGVKPAPVPTPFRFETRPPTVRPAAGYTLTWRAGPGAPAEAVGTTDRAGRVALPPELADGLVTLRLLAGGVEPLVEFPALPGETAEERVVRIDPLTEAVAFQAQLSALRDEVIDLVAIRARLDVLLQARISGEAWDDVKALLDEFHRLPPRETFTRRLDTLQADAVRRQQEQKVPILTATVRSRLADTEALILRYLDDEAFRGYELAYREATSPDEVQEPRRPAPPPAPATLAEEPAAPAPGPPPVGGVAF